MKYPNHVLTRMAQILLRLKEQEAPEYLLFVITVAQQSNTDPDYVEHKIQEYAKGIINHG